MQSQKQTHKAVIENTHVQLSFDASINPKDEDEVFLQPTITLLETDKKTTPSNVGLVIDVSGSMSIPVGKSVFEQYKIIWVPEEVKESDIKPNRCEIHIHKYDKHYINIYTINDNGEIIKSNDFNELTRTETSFSVLKEIIRNPNPSEIIKESFAKSIFNNLIQHDDKLHKISSLDLLVKSLCSWLPPNHQYSIITFSHEAKILATHQNQEETIKILRGLHPGGHTHIGGALIKINSEMHLDYALLFTDGKDTVSYALSPTDVMGILQKNLKKELTIRPIGLGPEYDDAVMTKYAEATHSPFFHLKDGLEIADFFKNKASDLVGDKPIPLHLELKIADQHLHFVKTLKGAGLNTSDRVWAEVLTGYYTAEKREKVKFELIFTSSTTQEKVTWVGEFNLVESLPVIEYYAQKMAFDIFNSQKQDNVKSLKLQWLLGLFKSYPESDTKANIIRLLQTLQLTGEKKKEARTLMRAGMTRNTTTGVTAKIEISLKHSGIYSPDTQKIVIGKKSFQLIDHTLDFADEKTQHLNLVSINDYKTLAGTTIPSDLFIKLKKQFKSLFEVSAEPLEVLSKIIFEVLITFPNDRTVPRRKYHALSKLIKQKIGANDHIALLTTVLTGSLVQAKVLPPGKVHHFRSFTYNLRVHSWTIYDTKEGLYLIDTMLATKTSADALSIKIFNLRNPKEALLAIQTYKELNYEGVLKKLFEHYKLAHPEMTHIDDKAIELIRHHYPKTLTKLLEQEKDKKESLEEPRTDVIKKPLKPSEQELKQDSKVFALIWKNILKLRDKIALPAERTPHPNLKEMDLKEIIVVPLSEMGSSIATSTLKKPEEKLNQDLSEELNQKTISLPNIIKLLQKGANPHVEPRVFKSLLKILIDHSHTETADTQQLKKILGFPNNQQWFLWDWTKCQLLYACQKESKDQTQEIDALITAAGISHNQKGTLKHENGGYYLLLSPEEHTKLLKIVELGLARFKSYFGDNQELIDQIEQIPEINIEQKMSMATPKSFFTSSTILATPSAQQVKEQERARTAIRHAIFTVLVDTKDSSLNSMKQKLEQIPITKNSVLDQYRSTLLQQINKQLGKTEDQSPKNQMVMKVM